MSGHRLQSVALRVPELDVARRFYRDWVGLEELSTADERCELGADDGPIVRLVAAPDAAKRDSEAGLFHLAILFPDRTSLADALGRFSHADYRMTGASDHAVSEALYLDDPGGNGVELYRDRPASAWKRDDSGEVRMTTEPLDLASLKQQASKKTPDAAPGATTLGHIHLEVTDLERSVALGSGVNGANGANG